MFAQKIFPYFIAVLLCAGTYVHGEDCAPNLSFEEKLGLVSDGLLYRAFVGLYPIADPGSCKRVFAADTHFASGSIGPDFLVNCANVPAKNCASANREKLAGKNLALTPDFCVQQSLKFRRALDVGGNCAFTVMTKDLKIALKQPWVGTYLSDLNEAMGKGKINLYDFTLNHRHVQNPAKAIELIAVLFQDRSELGGDCNRQPNSELLNEARRLIETKRRKGQIDFFPKPVPEVDHSPYHFYVPAALAQRMNECRTIVTDAPGPTLCRCF